MIANPHAAQPTETTEESARAARREERRGLAQADIALMGRIAQRDIAAFEQLYDRFSASMFSLVVRIVRSRPEAEEVLLEVFHLIWIRASDYREQLGSPFAWSATIMRRRAIDRLRASGRHQIPREEPALNGECGDSPGSRSAIIAEETGREVRAAFAALGAGESRAIELAFFDALTHGEIAAHLGLPVGTVKARIRGGMLKLRDGLVRLG